MPVAVCLGRIHEIDAEIDGAFHRLPTVRITNVGAPGLAPGLPHPQPDRGNGRSTATQRDVFQTTAARPTRLPAKNLSRSEFEPFGRMVREPEPEERFVVLVVQAIGLRDPLPVGLLEAGPVFRFDRPADRPEGLSDKG